MLNAGGRWPSGGKLPHRTPELGAKAKETSADKLNRFVSKYFPTRISALSVPLWGFVVVLVCFSLCLFFKLDGEHTDLTASLKPANTKTEKSPDHRSLFFVFNTTI